MKRRDFLTSTMAIAALTPLAAFAAPVSYSDGLVKQLLSEGKTVFVDFKAEWCSTCKSQERTINALLEENPAYAENVSFVNVDWDEFGKGALSKSLGIPRRSTLVVLKGDAELGRLVAVTGQAEIKALMDTALEAAQS